MPEPANHPPKVTLEDLLRLKRHERPAPEFWARFDRELQERSMRALMEPAPSRGNWLRVLLGRPAAWLSTGVTAALVAGFVWQGNFGSPSFSVAYVPDLQVHNAASATPAAAPVNPSPVAEDFTAAIQPKFVVTSLPQTVPTANYQKVATSLAFAVDTSSGAELTVDALEGAALRSHTHSSAY